MEAQPEPEEQAVLPVPLVPVVLRALAERVEAVATAAQAALAGLAASVGLVAQVVAGQGASQVHRAVQDQTVALVVMVALAVLR